MYLPCIIYTLYQRTMQGTQHAQIKQCYMFLAWKYSQYVNSSAIVVLPSVSHSVSQSVRASCEHFDKAEHRDATNEFALNSNNSSGMFDMLWQK